MGHPPYPYEQIKSTRYTFFSIGKTRIEKVVDFVAVGSRNIMNLGFGDLRPDGSIDDKINSNNGDIVQVMATIIEILKDFTKNHPNAIIHFEGSTKERTRLYARILKTYYSTFSKEFHVFAFVEENGRDRLLQFDPRVNTEYSAFLVKKIA